MDMQRQLELSRVSGVLFKNQDHLERRTSVAWVAEQVGMELGETLIALKDLEKRGDIDNMRIHWDIHGIGLDVWLGTMVCPMLGQEDWS